ncbi:MAG TPA: DUF4870 domain-containing protein [Anaerolineales bacterium]
MNTPPTTEERIWAVFSHLSSVAFGMGIVLPIIGWSEQRRKSKYASFQCLQALGYQSVGFTVWVLSYLLIVFLGAMILLVTLGSDPAGRQNPINLQTPGLIVFFLVLFGYFALYLLLPVLAAIACALGRDFRYPILGHRLTHYLHYEPAQEAEGQLWLHEDHEFRWVAAMGHFSILILLWGMLAPLTALILQGKHSFFLRFQSIQTLVYQAGTTLLFVAGGMISALASVALPLLSLSVFAVDPDSLLLPVGLIVFIALLLLPLVIILLIVPLFHILGQWAGYRVLKGDNYRYPLVGKLVEKHISKKSALEEIPE